MGGKIRGYEEQFMEHIARGEFSVDSEGNIWRHVDLRIGKIDPPRRAERGKPGSYLQVRFMHNGSRLAATAHRVVYRALKGPIPEGLEINHDNGIKDFNHPTNLIPETSGGNQKHAFASGLRDQHGQRNPAAKLTDSQVAQIRLAYSKGGITMEQLATRFAVKLQQVSKIVRGQRRPKQGGPVAGSDLRHSVCASDPVTGRFIGKPHLLIREFPHA